MEEKVSTMKDPKFREKILSEQPVSIGNPLVEEITQFESIYSLTTDLEDNTEYEDEVEEVIDEE